MVIKLTEWLHARSCRQNRLYMCMTLCTSNEVRAALYSINRCAWQQMCAKVTIQDSEHSPFWSGSKSPPLQNKGCHFCNLREKFQSCIIQLKVEPQNHVESWATKSVWKLSCKISESWATKSGWKSSFLVLSTSLTSSRTVWTTSSLRSFRSEIV